MANCAANTIARNVNRQLNTVVGKAMSGSRLYVRALQPRASERRNTRLAAGRCAS
jgi:hypothetical protein